MRRINKAGFDLVRNFEGLRLKAYPDPGTGGAPWTVGWGHTGKDVKPGMVITRDQADSLLMGDLERFERFVEEHAGACTDNQFAALVSFAYNCGPANLEESTLLRLHRDGRYAEAKQQFARWNKAAGKVLNGLTRRRAAEAALYGAA